MGKGGGSMGGVLGEPMASPANLKNHNMAFNKSSVPS